MNDMNMFSKEFLKINENYRNSKCSEKRRMQYLQLIRTKHDSNNISSTVPHPVTHTASQKIISSQNETLNSKMGIYKSCNGKILSVIEYSVNNVSIRSLQFSNDSKLLILGLSSGDLQGIKVSDNSLHKEFTRNENEKNCPITCIKFNPNPAYHDMFYRGSSTGNIALFCVNGKRRREELQTGNVVNQINSLDVDKTGKNLVSGGKDAIIRIHSTETHQLVKEYRRKDYNDNPEEKNAGFHRLRVFVVRFHPEEANLFVSSGWDSLVKIWDVRTPSGCVNTIIGTHISGNSVDLKKNVLLTGSFEPNVGLQLWDIRTTKYIMNCNPINVIRQFEGLFINNAQFFYGDSLGDIILTSNVAIKSLDVISLKKKMLLHTFNCSQPVSAVHSNENKIAFGDMGQQLFICEFYVAGTINDSIEKKY